jgi:hypothetical protein
MNTVTFATLLSLTGTQAFHIINLSDGETFQHCATANDCSTEPYVWGTSWGGQQDKRMFFAAWDGYGFTFPTESGWANTWYSGGTEALNHAGRSVVADKFSIPDGNYDQWECTKQCGNDNRPVDDTYWYIASGLKTPGGWVRRTGSVQGVVEKGLLNGIFRGCILGCSCDASPDDTFPDLPNLDAADYATCDAWCDPINAPRTQYTTTSDWYVYDDANNLRAYTKFYKYATVVLPWSAYKSPSQTYGRFFQSTGVYPLIFTTSAEPSAFEQMEDISTAACVASCQGRGICGVGPDTSSAPSFQLDKCIFVLVASGVLSM